MILALIMLAQAAILPPVAGEEITVFARKLDSVSVWLAPDARGKLACGMNPSSGDTRIDAKLCRAAARCVKDGVSGNDAMKLCIDKRKPDLVREFAANLKTR